MLRRLIFVAIFVGCILPMGASAVEFSLSDKGTVPPTPTPVPQPDFPNASSIIDDLSVPPVPELAHPNQAPIFSSPLEAVPMEGIPVEGIPVEGIPMEGIPSEGVIQSAPVEELNDQLTVTAVGAPEANWVGDACNDCNGAAGDLNFGFAEPTSQQRLGGLLGSRGGLLGSGGRRGSFFDGFCMDLWVASGFTWNPEDPPSGLNTPLTFNDQANDYQLNQIYLAFGRRVAQSGSLFDLGGRFDLLYGSDYFFTQAVGLETRANGDNRWNSSNGPRDGGNAAIEGLALPQAYLEAYLPIFGGVNVKAGHFYTTLGYESVMSPENFFYSHSYTEQYGQPFTHTGVIATKQFTPGFSGHGGYTRGWDTWEDPNGKPGYLFGFSYEPNSIASLSATAHLGREDALGLNQRQVISIVYTRQVSNRLRYVFQHNFGQESNAEFDENFQPDEAKWYSANNYFFYDVSNRLTAGFRFEWFRDQDNARVLAIPQESLVEGGNYYQVSFGLNWAATSRLRFRPELRFDWSDVDPSAIAGSGAFNDFTDRNMTTASMDFIYKF